MQQSAWERFLYDLERTLYMELPVLLASFFLLYILIKHFRREKLSYLFLIYTMNCILLFVGLGIQRIFFPTTGRASTIIGETANTIFAIIELFVFNVFFFRIIESKTSKKFLLLFSGGFVVMIIFFFAKISDVHANRADIMKVSIVVNVLEFSVFLIAILSYFIEIFTKPPTQDLTRSPAFWISSGFFIYILASLPMLIFSEYIWTENKKLYFLLFSFHYASLTLLLFTIAKAFLCRKPIPT